MMGPTREIAEFVNLLRYEQIPHKVIRQAKQCILDQLGVQLVASSLEWSEIVYSATRSLQGERESTIVNYGDKTSATHAAFVNATFGHGCEFDDFGPVRGHGHPGCVVVPAAIAMGEKVHATGKDLIAAVVAGYEIEGRIGLSCGFSVLRRGFHNAWFIFGSVAAAGKILGLNADQLTNALGIAGGFAGGLRQYTKSGGETKRLHAGGAASNGILSVLLAQGGFPAPPDILEGETGFIKAFADTYRLEELTKGLNTEFLILETGFKRYPCNAGIQPVLETALRIADANNIRPDQIQRITVKTQAFRCDQMGKIYEPHSALAAQFSLPFSLGLALVKRRMDLPAFLDKSLWRDPELLSFAKKVTVEADPELDRLSVGGGEDPSHLFAGRVILTLVDGRCLEDINRPVKGMSPDEPLTWEDSVEKFERNAASVLSGTKVRRLVETIDNLDILGDVSELITHLAA